VIASHSRHGKHDAANEILIHTLVHLVLALVAVSLLRVPDSLSAGGWPDLTLADQLPSPAGEPSADRHLSINTHWCQVRIRAEPAKESGNIKPLV
jgi:hypothetical protein